jgi:hypothetical protein
MTRGPTALAAAALAAFLMPVAQAQQSVGPPQVPCAPRPAVIKSLSGEYKEEVIMRGIIDGRMLELWRGPEGTFSVTVTHAQNGMTCLIASGTSLHPVGPVKKGSKL